MKCVVTLFPHLLNPYGRRLETTWTALFQRFERPFECATKQDAPGWSPCLLERDSRAAGTRALALSALVVEHDDGRSVEAAAEVWGDWYGCIYTTFSHRPEAPRFRIVIPLSRTVTPEEHAQLWRWAQKIDPTIDAKARDAKRFWFLPAIAPGGVYEYRELAGAILDVPQVLRAVPPVVAPPPPPAPPRVGHGGVLSRASRYLRSMPESVAGSGGHLALWRASLALVRGFELSGDQALWLLTAEFNPRCIPPWSEKEIVHKVKQASQVAERPWGYLLDARRSA